MSIMPQDPGSNTPPPPDWIIEQGEDEDYVEFIVRQGEAYSTDPPPAPLGFELIECDAEPRHWPFYTVASEGYPPACPHCVQHSLMDAHDGCEHSRHGRWRRWRVAHWLAGQLYVSGLAVTGGGKSWGGGCNWCLSSLPKFRRGERPYILWVRRGTWRCLLRGRHTPGDPVAFGYCTKCLPCPDCGSKTAGHAPSCVGL